MLRYTKKAKLDTAIFAAVLILVVLAVAVLSLFNFKSTQEVMEEETEKYIGEVFRTTSSALSERINRNLRGLEAISVLLDYLDSADGEDALDYLRKNCVRYGFEELVIYDPDASPIVSVRTDELATMSDEVVLSELSIFSDALAGRNSVCIVDYSEEAGSGSLVYAVPFLIRGEPAGAVMGVTEKSRVRQFLSIDVFGGEGYVHLTDAEGNFLVLSNNYPADEPGDEAPGTIHGYTDVIGFLSNEATFESGFSAEKVREAMRAGEDYLYYFQLTDGVRKVSICAPMEIGGQAWFLHSVMPTSVTTDKMQYLIRQTVFVSTGTVLLFAVFAVLIFYVHRRGEKRLAKLAFEDPVTQGMSAARFERECAERIRSAPPGSFAMIAMDVDKFKLINDFFGSGNGDRTLRHILACMTAELAPGEFAARTSADKFGLLLRYEGEEALLLRLQTLIERVNAFNSGSAEKYFLAFSVGVYVVDEPELNMIAVQDRANSARKHSAGTSGGPLTRAVFFSERQRVALQFEKDIENRMEEALRQRRFVVYLQPKFGLEDGEIVGAEALVRWKDPEWGLVPPNSFIPVLEKNGFITKVDLFVFDEVCRMLQRWRRMGFERTVSVNLSRAHLSNPAFLQSYLDIFSRYDIPPEAVEFEFTETLVFEDAERFIEVVERMHRVGFLCSLDDFGSGYSSLNLLKDLKVDTLKLDRVFFGNAPEGDHRAESIVESIVGLAKRLNIVTVAEGVESDSQVDFLRRIHCDVVQGFVFARPMPEEEFEALALSKGGKDAGKAEGK